MSLRETFKLGSYRCITFKLYDTKGGDYVENKDLSILFVESSKQTVVADISKDLSLFQSPLGFYKKIEIGINNYDPNVFF